jgi:hypothetical protein
MSDGFQYRAGLGSVAAYQVSGIPYVTSSLAAISGSTPTKIDFGQVTKFIVVKNIDNSGTLKVGFSSNGTSGTNYFMLSKGESFAADVRVTELFLLSTNGSQVSASVIAGLTSIQKIDLPTNWSGSSGVG